jgi:anti-sigma-K factor RskA
MKYDQPELQMKLAAEYVLGTLHGKARTRFEKLLAHDAALRARVAAWEQRLSPWASVVKAKDPVPAQVWSGVQRRLGFVPAEQPKPAGNWWRWWAIGSTALAASLAALLVLLPPLVTRAPLPVVVIQPAPAYKDLAVLSSSAREPGWIVRVDGSHRHLMLTGLTAQNLPVGKTLELWSIPAGGAPLSLGVIALHEGHAELTLDAGRQGRLAQATVLAISLEPSGGSPTGLPTGPVLYTGKPVGA